MRLTLSSKRRHTTSYAVVSYQILLVMSVICSIALANSPPATTIEISGLVIKQLDKDMLPSKTAEAVETKTVTIVVEATPKTYKPNDDDDDNSGNSWQNGGHVKPNIVATGDATSSAEPTNTSAAGDDHPQPSPLPNNDGVNDNYTDPNANGVKRLVLISSLHYLDIPSLSHDGSSSRSMRTLAHTQAIPPPSAPTAKELNDDHDNLYHLVARDYSSSSAGPPSGSRTISTYRDDSSVTSSQDAPPAYTPSAPPHYILADYPGPHIIGTSRSRQQHDRAPSRPSRRE
ncbi:hypothetical protein BC943DRAFT_195316 [Umbelopsis sp. AD052]|nr:hypothetical protein BC943DRAFT_195316 [Umbelopsis sp. AD052]